MSLECLRVAVAKTRVFNFAPTYTNNLYDAGGKKC